MLEELLAHILGWNQQLIIEMQPQLNSHSSIGATANLIPHMVFLSCTPKGIMHSIGYSYLPRVGILQDMQDQPLHCSIPWGQ